MSHFAPESLPRLTSDKNTPKYSGAFWRRPFMKKCDLLLLRVPARFRPLRIPAHILAHMFSRRFFMIMLMRA